MEARNIIERLLAIRSVSPARLIAETGIPQSTLNSILHGESKTPTDKTLKPIADFFGVTLSQLRGYEPLDFGDSNTQDIIRLENYCPIFQNHSVLIEMWLTGNLPKNDAQFYVRTAYSRPERTFIMAVTDDVLEPELAAGDYVFVVPGAEYGDTDYVMIRTPTGFVFRLVQQRKNGLMVVNPTGPETSAEREDIVGVVDGFPEVSPSGYRSAQHIEIESYFDILK